MQLKNSKTESLTHPRVRQLSFVWVPQALTCHFPFGSEPINSTRFPNCAQIATRPTLAISLLCFTLSKLFVKNISNELQTKVQCAFPCTPSFLLSVEMDFVWGSYFVALSFLSNCCFKLLDQMFTQTQINLFCEHYQSGEGSKGGGWACRKKITYGDRAHSSEHSCKREGHLRSWRALLWIGSMALLGNLR